MIKNRISISRKYYTNAQQYICKIGEKVINSKLLSHIKLCA